MWNYDEKGVCPEGKWSPVYTEGVQMVNGVPMAKRTFRHTSMERAPFWVTIGLFTRADGQCPVGPVVCHQAAKLTATHSKNLVDPCTVWCTPSGNTWS